MSNNEISLLIGETRPELYGTNLLQMVLDTAQRYPERIALRYGDLSFDYRSLVATALKMGQHLWQAREVRPGMRVGIFSHPGAAAALDFLAVLSCGATYVPLNPDYPDDRLQTICESGEVHCILADQEVIDRVDGWSPQLVEHNRLMQECRNQEVQSPCAMPAARDLAYIMYTSGSTGTPKGVPIYHEGVVSQMAAFGEKLQVGAHDRLLSLAALSFDISVLEHYLPWWAGAEVCLVPRGVARNGRELLKHFESYQPTIIQGTPATWRIVLEEGWGGAPQAKILTGGEALSRRMADELVPRCHQLWNLYGPTETTIWATMQHIQADEGPVSLGPPILNTSVCILDEQCQPVNFGCEGEICIGGIGLSPGYVARPELTADRFVSNPLPVEGHERVYRTGDRGRLHANGVLEYLGRMDFQVKLRGYRIELGEIESVLAAHPSVRQGVVVLREDLATPQLVAYVSGEKTSSDEELREFLGRKLPDFMVPSIIVWMDQFVLNVNGKVDRKQLPKPQVDLGSELPDAEQQTDDPAVNAARALLGDPRITGESDLFRHGLDSLRAAQLARSLEQIYTVPIALDTIFQSRTLAKLAQAIGQERAPIFPIGEDHGYPRIYVLSTLTGSVPQDLGLELSNSLSVFGIQARSELDINSIEALAAMHLRDLRQMHDLTQPLNLIGFSFGGFVALEMARQWMLEGGKMGHLVVLDSEINHLLPSPRRKLFNYTLELISSAVSLLGWALPQSWRATSLYQRIERTGRRKRFQRGRGPGLSENETLQMLSAIPGFEGLPQSNRQLALRNFRIDESYRPRGLGSGVIFPGRVLLLRRKLYFWQEQCLGWSRLGCQLQQVELDTRVHEVLNSQNYPVIAQHVQQALKG